MEAILVQKALEFFTVKKLKSETLKAPQLTMYLHFCHLYISSKLGLTFEP